jgi:hypothetical protein
MECALAITNGRISAFTRHGQPVWLQQRQQLLDCAVCRDRLPYGRQGKRVDHDHLRSVLVLADLPEPPPPLGFAEVPDQTIVSISHDLKVEQSQLAR